jgi:hypothetical protein
MVSSLRTAADGPAPASTAGSGHEAVELVADATQMVGRDDVAGLQLRDAHPLHDRSKPLDARSDLFALGLVLYELIAGVQPFRADTFGKLLVEITSKPPPALPDVTALGEPVHPVLKANCERKRLPNVSTIRATWIRT